MSSKLILAAALTVTLFSAPAFAARLDGAVFDTAPSLLLVAHHHDHHDFDRGDVRGLVKAMGYKVIDINEGRHGFLVIGVNHDGKWRLFIDEDGDVRSVTHVGGGHDNHHNGDDNNDDDDGDD